MPTIPGPDTSLISSHPYNKLINFDKTDNSIPNSSSTQTESKMRDSAPLAIFDGTVSDAPGYNHFESFSPTSQAGFAPWTPWPENQQPATQERTGYGYKSDQRYTSVPTEKSYEGLEHQKPTEHEPWTQGIYPGPAHPLSYPEFPMNYGFASDHDSSQTASMRRTFLPLPTGASHGRPWDDSDIAITRNEVLTPRPRHSHVFPFDAADGSGPALYSTVSGLQANVPSATNYVYRNVDDTMTSGSCETDSESAKGEPPYAKLIYNALMDAPEHKLVLRDIYAWISDNTDKAKDPAFKGWQNSVRHNLSMNGVRPCCHE